ncbi:hypothetical protein [Morganella morganii]|uniref:hypothetical protein n=1 Tax=Morganella morganii TaxID=582 RepID=UPI0020239ACA|nr:hypothetical protein [Morganella morganii]
MKRPVISLRTYRQETLEHSHDDMWQLVLGGSGAMELTVGSDSGSVEQGRMAAIPPGYHHRFCGTGHNRQVVLELPADSLFFTSPGCPSKSQAVIGMLLTCLF